MLPESYTVGLSPAPFCPESRIALTLDNMPDTVSELDTLVVPGDSGLCQSVVGEAIVN